MAPSNDRGSPCNPCNTLLVKKINAYGQGASVAAFCANAAHSIELFGPEKTYRIRQRNSKTRVFYFHGAFRNDMCCARCKCLYIFKLVCFWSNFNGSIYG